MVLDPIPQSLPVHFFGSRPQPPTSRRMATIKAFGYDEGLFYRCARLSCRTHTGLFCTDPSTWTFQHTCYTLSYQIITATSIKSLSTYIAFGVWCLCWPLLPMDAALFLGLKCGFFQRYIDPYYYLGVLCSGEIWGV